MPTIAENLAAAVALAQADAAKLDAVVHGPAAGPTSLVATNAGDVKTLARITAEAAAAAAAGVVPFTPPVPWVSGLNAVVGPPATAVIYLGESYFCNTGHVTGATFAPDAAKWTKFAAKGVDGVDGPNGANGAAGLSTRRQTVVGGPVTAAGFPDFFPAAAAGLVLTQQNVSALAPFVVAAANGFGASGANDRVGISIVNLAWPAFPDNSTSYAYVDVAANGVLTPGHTTLAPAYQQAGAYSLVNGQHTFNIVEMMMKVGDGAAANQVWRVFVGEVVTAAGAITSAIAYAYDGRYDSGYTPTLPAAGTAVVKNHNLGVIPGAMDFRANCTTSDAGWAVGDEVGLGALNGYNGSSLTNPALGASTKAMTSQCSGFPWYVLHKSTGVSTSLTATSWKYKFTADRGW